MQKGRGLVPNGQFRNVPFLLFTKSTGWHKPFHAQIKALLAASCYGLAAPKESVKNIILPHTFCLCYAFFVAPFAAHGERALPPTKRASPRTVRLFMSQNPSGDHGRQGSAGSGRIAAGDGKQRRQKCLTGPLNYNPRGQGANGQQGQVCVIDALAKKRKKQLERQKTMAVKSGIAEEEIVRNSKTIIALI